MRKPQFTSSFHGRSQEAGFRRVFDPRPAGAAAIAVLVVLGTVSACSYVPDAVNPVQWYKGVAGWFGEDEEPEAETRTAEATAMPGPSGEEQSFPTLAEVPERPVPATTLAERRRIMEGLTADREHARYAEDLAAAAAEPGPLPAAEPESQPAAPAPELAAPAAEAPSPPPKAVAAAPEDAGRKRLVSPLETTPVPPPVPKAAPAEMARGVGRAPSAAAPGAGGLGELYQGKLQESAPTVSTATVGPAAQIAALPPETGAPESRENMLALGPAVDWDLFRSTVSVQVGTVAFAHNSSRLAPVGRKVLKDVARLHKERGGIVRVIGHASHRTRDMDPVRHQLANFTVSVRRADVVARELVRHGVEPSKLFVGAKSDAEPIYYESMPAGEAGNRRTEIFIDY